MTIASTAEVIHSLEQHCPGQGEDLYDAHWQWADACCREGHKAEHIAESILREERILKGFPSDDYPIEWD